MRSLWTEVDTGQEVAEMGVRFTRCLKIAFAEGRNDLSDRDASVDKVPLWEVPRTGRRGAPLSWAFIHSCIHAFLYFF